MAQLYFAEDGSWGDATDLIILDDDDYRFTDEQWEEISNATDSERAKLVQRFKDEHDGLLDEDAEEVEEPNES